MLIAHSEPAHHSATYKTGPGGNSPTGSTFAHTLERMQSSMTEEQPFTDEQARMVIRMVGAAITGQFQQVTGWSGEQAETFFSRFNMLQSYSNQGQERPAVLSASRHAAGSYQEARPATEQKSAPAPAATQANRSTTSNPVADSRPDNTSSATTDIHQLIDEVAQRMDLPAKLVHSVVFAESSYRADAVSPAGAEGLMQLMPATAQEVGVENTFDPQDNLTGGCRYLKGLLDKYHGDLDHALAAYNWGQGNVDRKGLEQMPLETRTYISRVKEGLDTRA